MSWLEKLHPRAPRGTEHGGEFVGRDWATRLVDSLSSDHGDLSHPNSGLDWVALGSARGTKTGEYDMVTDDGRDGVLDRLYTERGYHAKPTVVSEAELQDAVDHGATEVWRGYESSGGHTAQHYMEDFRTGDRHYAGTGVYGNGTYTATERDTARAYADGNKTVLHMALHPSARVLYIDQAKARHDELDSMAPQDAGVHGKQILAHERVIADLGRLATLMGYDALHVVRRNEGGDYVIILNRGAVMVAR